MSDFCLVVVVVVVTVLVDVVFVVVIVQMLFRYPLRFILGSLRWKLSFGWCGVWWDGGLWWAVLVCRPIFMSNPTQLSWKGHLSRAVR